MKRALTYILYFFLVSSVIAQTDSLKTGTIKSSSDSLKTDSTKSSIDTLKQIKSDISAPINYSARDSAIFDVK